MTRAVTIAPELVAGVLQSAEGVYVEGLERPVLSVSDGRCHELVWLRGEASTETLQSLHDRLSEELARRSILAAVPNGSDAEGLPEVLRAWAQRQQERHRGVVSVEVVLERQAWMETLLWARQDGIQRAGLPMQYRQDALGDPAFFYAGVHYRTVTGAVPRVHLLVDGKVVEEVSLLLIEHAKGGPRG